MVAANFVEEQGANAFGGTVEHALEQRRRPHHFGYEAQLAIPLVEVPGIQRQITEECGSSHCDVGDGERIGVLRRVAGNARVGFFSLLCRSMEFSNGFGQIALFPACDDIVGRRQES